MKPLKIIIAMILLWGNTLINAQNWSEPRIVSAISYDHINPDFYIDSNHVIHSVWTRCLPSNYRNICYSKSSDDGYTWSMPEHLSQNNLLLPGNPHIVGDVQNRLHVTYDFNLEVPENRVVRYTSCNANGIWNQSITTLSEEKPTYNSSIYIDHNDKIYCFWLRSNEIQYKILENGMWNGPFTAPYSGIKGVNKAVVDPNNNLLFTNAKQVGADVLDSVSVYYTLNANGEWSEMTQLSDKKQFGASDITIDAEGNPHIIRGEITKTNTLGNATHEGSIHQYYNGSTWEQDLLTEIPNMGQVFYSAIAFDKYNQPHIVQTEERDGSHFHMHYQFINGLWVGVEISENNRGFFYNRLISHHGYLYLEYSEYVNALHRKVKLRTLEEKPIATTTYKAPITSLTVAPNPLEIQSIIDYSLQHASNVIIKAYNINGDCVKIWNPGQQSTGSYQLTWNGSDHNGNRLPKGIYIISLHAGKYVTSKKIVVN